MFILQTILRTDPQGAVNFALMMSQMEGGCLLDYNTITDLFLQRNLIREATSFLLDVLKPNLPEHGYLQTKWTDCKLAGALGLLRILTYTMGRPLCLSMKSKQASIKELYGGLFPSLLQLQTGIAEFEAWKQKELCPAKYRRPGLHERRESTKLEKELDEECGICMEMNTKVVLPNCCHSLCFKCYQDWYARSFRAITVVVGCLLEVWFLLYEY